MVEVSQSCSDTQGSYCSVGAASSSVLWARAGETSITVIIEDANASANPLYRLRMRAAFPACPLNNVRSSSYSITRMWRGLCVAFEGEAYEAVE